MSTPPPVAAADVDRVALVVDNLRLVRHVARRFAGRGLDADDLYGHGVFGLLRAAAMFDPGCGHRFSTLASPWIRIYIRQGLAASGRTIRLPKNALVFLADFQRAAAATPGDGPDDEAVLEAMGVTPLARRSRRAILRAFRAGVTSLLDESHEAEAAIHVPATEDGPGPAEMEEEARTTAARVESLLAALPPRWREVVTLHHGLGGGDPMSLAAVARRTGLSRERARQIHGSAIRRLRGKFGPGAPP